MLIINLSLFIHDVIKLLDVFFLFCLQFHQFMLYIMFINIILYISVIVFKALPYITFVRFF